jgi:glyoxylase-like metal-dependent hydrolase (beta-lactamase superfamily II)
MKVKTLTVGPLAENCFIVFEENSKDAVIIDPGADGDFIIDELKDLNVKAILATHGHLDHVGQVGYLKEKLYASFYMNKKDEFLINNEIFPNFAYIIKAVKCPSPDFDAKDGDVLKFGNLEFQVIESPGHTPGSVCFFNGKEKIIFVGDTLFKRSVGRTDLPGGNGKMLEQSLRKLMELPEDTVVYSGHGPKTTIGIEKRTNPFITGAFRLKW